MKEGGKKGKIKRNKLQKNFCLDASTWRDEMPLIKVAYLMLNFLNLKSFLSNLFFLSSIQPQHAVGNGVPAMGCRQCLPLSVVKLKGKHCRKRHCHNGVVDTFRLGLSNYLPTNISKLVILKSFTSFEQLNVYHCTSKQTLLILTT